MMHKANALVIAIFLAVSLAAHAQAQTFSFSALNSILVNIDASATGSVEPSSCLVSIYMKGDSLVQDVNKFQSIGIINTNINSGFLVNHKELLEYIISLTDAEATTFNIFRSQTGLTQCSFKVYEDSADTYGNIQHNLLFSYDFTRDTYSKINQDNFVATNFGSVASNFVQTPQMDDIVQQATADASNMQ